MFTSASNSDLCEEIRSWTYSCCSSKSCFRVRELSMVDPDPRAGDLLLSSLVLDDFFVPLICFLNYSDLEQIENISFLETPFDIQSKSQTTSAGISYGYKQCITNLYL